MGSGVTLRTPETPAGQTPAGMFDPAMTRGGRAPLAFEPAIGHAHPRRDAAIWNYAGLVTAMGKSATEIAATIATLRREAGLPSA